MKIEQWFLDKATAQIPGKLERRQVREELYEHLEDRMQELASHGMQEEAAWREAVKSMGDPDEIAVSMGQIHSYDSSDAFSRMVGILWAGYLLTFIHPGSGLFGILWVWAGRSLILTALFRIRTVNRNLNRSFSWTAACFACTFLTAAADALQVEPIRMFFEGIFTAVQAIAGTIAVWHQLKGFWDLTDEGGQKILKCWWIVRLLSCITVIAGVAAGLLQGNNSWNIRIHLSDCSLSGALVLVFGFAAFAWIIIYPVFSWKLMKKLKANDMVGIGPFDKRSAILCIPAAGIAVSLPFLVSASISLWPVKPAAYISTAVTENTAWEQIQNKINCEKEAVLPQAVLSDAEWQEVVDRLGTVIPPEELRIFQEAESILIWGQKKVPDKGEPADMILYAAVLPSDGSVSYRIGCLTCFEAPFSGYTAVSSLWAGDAYFCPQMPDSGYRAVLLYEKDGSLWQFAPRYQMADSGMMAVEYALNREANRIYCYQAMNVAEREPGRGEEITVGYQNALQKSLFRIPYDTTRYQWTYLPLNPLQTTGSASGAGGNEITFQNGIIFNRDTFVWTQWGKLLYIDVKTAP